jgi:hypothetical protein
MRALPRRARANAMKDTEGRLAGSLHIFVLSGFAVAQPLYDLIRQYPTFLVAHHVRLADLILFVTLVSFGVPIAIAVVEFTFRYISKPLGRGIHDFFVFVLSLLICLPVLKKAEIGWLPVPAGIVLAGAFTLAYHKWRHVRTAITCLSPAIVVFPAWFLFTGPVADILNSRSGELTTRAKFESTPPIVFVIFDEFTSVSLMDGQRKIDADRFPNFAAVAAQAYWFRNATTNAGVTRYAIPAMVTGAFPPRDRQTLPLLRNYPHNLFTLLEGTYSYNVIEPLTELCPDRLKNQSQSLSRSSLFTDAGLVYLHVILPSIVTERLPSVSQTWAGFLSDDGMTPEPAAEDSEAFDWKGKLGDLRKRGHYREVFRRFIAAIDEHAQPSLCFYHCSLPHLPYAYLPSTKKYDARRFPSFLNDQILVDDWYSVNVAYQRYLLQVQCVDTLLGELISALKEKGLYDRALIVLTSDHGANYVPGEPRRLLTEESYNEILPVPLIVKLPHQKEGVIDDRNVESIDVLPTIADVLGVELDWHVDGVSALSDPQNARPRKEAFTDVTKPRYYDARFEEKYDALRQKIEIFGTGKDPLALYRIGPNPELIGRHIDQMQFAKASRITIRLDNAAMFQNVRLQGATLPVAISGTIVDKRRRKPVKELVVAVNGTIYAVTRSFKLKKRQKFEKFVCLVPESSLHAGRNSVEVYITRKDPSGVIQLLRLN